MLQGDPIASPIQGSSSSAADVAGPAVELQGSASTAPDAPASTAHETPAQSSGDADHTAAAEAASCTPSRSHEMQPPERQASTGTAQHPADGAAHHSAPEPAAVATEAHSGAPVLSGTGRRSGDHELVLQRIQQQWAMRTSATQPFPSHESASASLRQSLLSTHEPDGDSSSPSPLRQSTDAALRASAVGPRLARQASEQAQLPLRGTVDVSLRGSAVRLPLAQPAMVTEGAAAVQLHRAVVQNGAEPSAPGLTVVDSQQAAAGHMGHIAPAGQAAAAVTGDEASLTEQQQRSMPAAGVPAAAGLQMQPLDVSIIHMTPLVVEGKPIYPGACRRPVLNIPLLPAALCSAVFAAAAALHTSSNAFKKPQVPLHLANMLHWEHKPSVGAIPCVH